MSLEKKKKQAHLRIVNKNSYGGIETNFLIRKDMLNSTEYPLDSKRTLKPIVSRGKRKIPFK